MNSNAQGNMSNMVLSNSSMGGMGGGMIKQQLGSGPGGMMNAGPGVGPGNMGPGTVGRPNQGMHMGGPGHPQVLQNGPMMRMVGQQHMIRGPNPHLMSGNGPGGGGPRMQNPNLQMGKFNSFFFHKIVNSLAIL